MKRLISHIMAAAVIFTISSAAFARPADVISKEEAKKLLMIRDFQKMK